MNEAARAYGPEIVQVSAGYGDSRKQVLVANTDGVLTDDEIVRTLVRISAIADGDTGMQTGYQSMGHTVGFEIFDKVDVEELAREAARQAITKLRARPAPSGAMPVVIKHGTGGVLFHEACGHGLEADHIQKDASVYAGKVGQQVASPLGHAGRRRHDARRVGHTRLRRRGPRHSAQRADRGRHPHRLHVGLPARTQGWPRPVRQRAPPELSTSADGSHDQHVRPRRARRSGRHHQLDSQLGSTSPSSGAGRSTLRPATSCSG